MPNRRCKSCGETFCHEEYRDPCNGLAGVDDAYEIQQREYDWEQVHFRCPNCDSLDTEAIEESK